MSHSIFFAISVKFYFPASRLVQETYVIMQQREETKAAPMSCKAASDKRATI